MPNGHGLAALLEISKSLVVTLDLRTVLQAAVDGVERLSGLQTAAVYLLDGPQLRLWATTPPLPPDFPEYLRLAPLADHPYVGRALDTNQPTLVPDQRMVELTPAEAEVMRQRDLRTVLFLPLVAGAKPVGSLIVGSIGQPRAVSPADVDLCYTLANLAALAVENARLFESVQQQTVELRKTLAQRQQAEEARERLQAQLLQAQKLESIGRLAGGVAHDFNNMLQVILSCTEPVRGDVGPHPTAEENLAEIRLAALRASNLTRQLLAFARQQAAEPRVLDLNDLVDGMLTMLRRLIGENIDLRWNPGANLRPVRIDPSHVEQILANLFVNARDAIRDTGQMVVETSSTTLDAAFCASHAGMLPGEYVALSVTDTGCGMDRETVAQIFEPFFTTKPAGQGTGLGLATVYGIVSQNRGSISVRSERGKGSSFQIVLPAYDGPIDPTPAEHHAPLPAVSEATVLLVEDEPAILRIVSTMLHRVGYAVLAAGTPEEALQLARTRPGEIRLLVTDMVMPGLNGRELATRIRSFEPGVKVLYMSGYSADAVADRGGLDHASAFISKPFGLREIVDKIRGMLSPHPGGDGEGAG